MATRTSSRKSRRRGAMVQRKKFTPPHHFELLFAAALALPGLAIPTQTSAQSPADGSTFSAGYLDFQDHQKGVQGVTVHSPTLYFKTPLWSRTEIEGGLTYDSVSGASAFNLSPGSVPAPPPIVAVPTPVVPPPCRLFPIQSITRASGSSSGSSAGSSGGSSNSSGGASSGGSLPTSNPVCSDSQNPIVDSLGNGSQSQGEGEENEGRDEERSYSAARFSDHVNSASLGTFSDERVAADVKVTHYFDSFSLGGGVGLSTESDYDSLSTLVESRIWTPSKNTTFAIGVSANFDSVSSSIDSSLNDSKNSQNFLMGVTQVLSTDSIMQSNVVVMNDQGYLSDPYEPNDNRPDSRHGIAWLTRYNLYIEPADAALHIDYRLYGDSWGLVSHTIETAWYQPVLSWLLLRPSFRYYLQNEADFYVYDPAVTPNAGAHFSADQRLSAFGGVTLGLKAVADLGKGYSGSIGFDYLTQSSDLTFGRPSESAKRDSLSAEFIFVGLTKKF